MKPLKTLAALTTMAGALACLSGCGMLKAITNPSSAWAFNEPSPMSVVVRRSEVATGIADQVDRIIGQAPADEAMRNALALSHADAQKLLEASGKEAAYGGQPLRVVPAEAWLQALGHACGKNEEYSTLVGLLGDDVAAAYADVAAQGKKLSGLKGRIAALEEKADAEGVKPADKTKYERDIAKLEKEVEKLEAAFDPKVEKLHKAVQKGARAASDEAKSTMRPVVAQLREAVEDAKNANSAAMMRYPLALPTLQDDLPTTVKRFVADVIEEQTGHRPSMDGIAPSVALEGGKVKLTINGIPHDKVGDIDPGAIVTETTDRTQRYVGRVFTLPADVAETEDRLTFQAELLEAWQAGLGRQEGGIDITDLEVMAAAQPTGSGPQAAGAAAPADDKRIKRSLGGVRLAPCRGGGLAPVLAKRKSTPKKDKKAAEASEQTASADDNAKTRSSDRAAKSATPEAGAKGDKPAAKGSSKEAKEAKGSSKDAKGSSNEAKAAKKPAKEPAAKAPAPGPRREAARAPAAPPGARLRDVGGEDEPVRYRPDPGEEQRP
jgi:hypothetical protein